MKSVSFQKVPFIAVAVIALISGPAAVGTAFAEEPGWQTPPEAGQVVPGPLGEPGWQALPGEPGWQ